MWLEVICGLVIFWLLSRFFSDDADPVPLDEDAVSFDATLVFSVADRLHKLYGGQVYVGLHIPDPDSASRRNIDIVLVTPRETVVVSVKNVAGIVSIDAKDGSWVCISNAASGHHKHKSEELRFPDPVAESKSQVAMLESYLEQRGVSLPKGYLSSKVICPNPNFRYFFFRVT